MTQPPSGDPDRLPPQWEELLRSMLGPAADDVLREIAERGGPQALGLRGPDGEPIDLAAMASAAGLPSDPASLSRALQQIQQMLSTTGEGPVNWDLARDLARQAAVSGGDASVSETDRREVRQAFSVAELWLDAATDLPPGGGQVHAWSRSEWVEATLPRWRTLAEPVAASVADALAQTLSSQGPDALGELGELGALGAAGGMSGADMLAGAGQMMRQLGGAVFGMQVGQAVGTLAREVFGGTDIGLPLLDRPGTALVPRNVTAFGEGLDVPDDEVRIFLAVREAAHARLFTHVSWLRGHLLAAVDAYARGIEIDLDRMEEAVRSIDPTDPAALQEALSGGVFALQTTPTQEAALLRLETSLALVEGWVEEVTAAAAAPHLPNAGALREMMRRRRAAGGPAEDTFATLVGLELRPRRSRDAARLWAQIAADRGQAARDAVWQHPDLLPDAEDLDDPAGFAARRAAEDTDHADVDRALAEIFGEAPTGEDDDPDNDDAAGPVNR